MRACAVSYKPSRQMHLILGVTHAQLQIDISSYPIAIQHNSIAGADRRIPRATLVIRSTVY
jgi:hypothetical protein